MWGSLLICYETTLCLKCPGTWAIPSRVLSTVLMTLPVLCWRDPTLSRAWRTWWMRGRRKKTINSSVKENRNDKIVNAILLFKSGITSVLFFMDSIPPTQCLKMTSRETNDIRTDESWRKKQTMRLDIDQNLLNISFSFLLRSASFCRCASSFIRSWKGRLLLR